MYRKLKYPWSSGDCRLQNSSRLLAMVFLVLLENVSQIGGFGYQQNANHNNKNNIYNLSPAQTMAHAASAAAALVAVAPESTLSDTHRLAKRMDLESCLGQFDVHKNTIIRTGESQAIGGKYLQGIELDTMDECQRLCCETDGCDVYIFEDKNDGYCYLFDCGPPENFHCKFTRHANYTSAVLTPARHVPEPTSTTTTQQPAQQSPPLHISTNPNISQQERELTSLKVKPETEANGAGSQSALLLGLGAQLAGNTVVGMSQSEVGFAPKAPNSTNACGRFQFSCHSGECIAVYNACDGIPQCEDGSDEGPECSGASVAGIVPLGTKAAHETIKNNVEAVPIQKPQVIQYQQQQVSQIQQQPMINNREDAAAWANRKSVGDTLPNEVGNTADLNSRIFSHKGGLQVPTNGVSSSANFPNANLSPIYAATLQGSGLYMPQSQDIQTTYSMGGSMATTGGGGGQQLMQQPTHILVPANVNWPQQSGTAFVAPPGPQLQQGPAYLANGGQPQLLQPLQNKPVAVLLPANVQQQQQPMLPQTAIADASAAELTNVAAAAASAAAPQSSAKASDSQPKQPQVVSDDEYEISEEESTQPPKKPHKHKKVKSKPTESKALPKPKDPIELALEEQKQPASPVHEQYKMIHENLAMEFRDHDGQSERPGGAVVSLTLGLLVTAALAILIGCRWRTVGRRSRRLGGKTPYAHEADFLVNGMYL